MLTLSVQSSLYSIKGKCLQRITVSMFSTTRNSSIFCKMRFLVLFTSRRESGDGSLFISVLSKSERELTCLV